MKKLFTFLILLVMAKPLYAGWPINTGRYIIAPTLTYYHSGDYWDKDGHFVHANGRQGFTSETFSIYGGYGINHQIDIIGSIPLSYQTSTSNGVGHSSFGANDLQAGVSYNIINFGYTSFLSVQLTGIVPLYKDTPTDYRGYQSVGADLKLSYTGGFTNFITKQGYYNVEVAGRDYFSKDGPLQMNYSAAAGFAFNRKNQLILEVGGVYSSSSNKNYSVNQTAIHDFRYTKASGTYIHALSRHYNLGLGGFYTFTGRNTGKGMGGDVQLLIRF